METIVRGIQNHRSFAKKKKKCTNEHENRWTTTKENLMLCSIWFLVLHQMPMTDAHCPIVHLILRVSAFEVCAQMRILAFDQCEYLEMERKS